LNPRYWPGRLEERHGDAEGGGGDAGVVVEDGVTLVPLVGTAALPSLILLSDGGVGDIDVDEIAALAAPLLEGTPAPAGSGADDAPDIEPPGPPGSGGGSGEVPPPTA
jgi:hypothetical protein